MPKTRKQKEEIIKNLIEKLDRSKSIVFTNYQGLTVAEMQELRSKMQKHNIDYNVVKNTLLKIAMGKSSLAEIKDQLSYSGSYALAFNYKDEVSAAKILYNFSEEHESLKIICGILDKKLLSKDEMISLAKLPNKEELLIRVLSIVAQPVSGLVNVLAAKIRSLILVIAAIEKSK